MPYRCWDPFSQSCSNKLPIFFILCINMLIYKLYGYVYVISLLVNKYKTHDVNCLWSTSGACMWCPLVVHWCISGTYLCISIERRHIARSSDTPEKRYAPIYLYPRLSYDTILYIYKYITCIILESKPN